MSIIKSNGAGSGASGGFFKGVATQSLRLDGGSQITLDNADAATSINIHFNSVSFSTLCSVYSNKQ